MNASDEFLIVYIEKMPPVLWAAWYSTVRDAKSKVALGQVLFDPATDSLRDLTTASIRTQ